MQQEFTESAPGRRVQRSELVDCTRWGDTRQHDLNNSELISIQIGIGHQSCIMRSCPSKSELFTQKR